MPRKPSAAKKPAPPRIKAKPPAEAYRHSAKRKNIPPAGLAAQGKLREAPKIQYAYNPHLPPVLRFDPAGKPDKLPDLIQTARSRPLTEEEARTLAEALRNHEPWLEWSAKREKKAFEVDPVALHIHERVSTQALLQVAARENVQRSFFADPQLSYRETVQFYQHDIDWTNRMILGDSLQVMASLAHREGLAGKVQMIYLDPPYGIKFASNFQPEIGRRDVKDKESDLTREPETVKAYRDTWTLGIHSYLAYLRDRLVLARELLTDSGSIFVQIGDENSHHVRELLDEVFGRENFVSEIVFKKTSGQSSRLLPNLADFVLWYAKDIELVKFNATFELKNRRDQIGVFYDHIELQSGIRRKLSAQESESQEFPEGSRVFQGSVLYSEGATQGGSFQIEVNGDAFQPPPKSHWKTSQQGMIRLLQAERVFIKGRTPRYIRFFEDFPCFPQSNIWTDTSFGGFVGDQSKIYVVQTYTKVIERCLLMTTDPGDLVLDPTCGSGTTAYVAEQWGRRWITIDTSRVALALARQRLLTATYPYYRVKNGENGNGSAPNGGNPAQGFLYKKVPHVTLKSIAQNVALDGIFARRQPVLDSRLADLNAALKNVPAELRQRLARKLAEKEKSEGKKAVTEADRRRWLLPKTAWKEWEVPFEADEEWPPDLQAALAAYRAAWRAKMDEVNAAIAANAEQEELVDQPEEVKGVVRVSGPFTMEAVMPIEESLESPISGEPGDLETFAPPPEPEPANAGAYLDKMRRLLQADGVRFPNNKTARFARLEPLGGEFLHAEGEWESGGRVAVSFGPEFGPVTAYQVENALRQASRRGYDDLVLAGFSFDAEAQAAIQEDPHPNVRCHLAHIRPDVNMGGLLKETPNSQIFTVFGSPRTELRTLKDGSFEIEMQGVDIYNPVDNTLQPTSADKVAAWFLDADYDGRTFCLTQAFFPDRDAWGKLARALKGVIDAEAFEAFSGTVSLPFTAGKHRRAAVKVIDPRGNEVMRVHRLGDGPAQYSRQ